MYAADKYMVLRYYQKPAPVNTALPRYVHAYVCEYIEISVRTWKLACTYASKRILLPLSTFTIADPFNHPLHNFLSTLSDWWLKCFSEPLWYTQLKLCGCSAASMSSYVISCHVTSHSIILFFSVLNRVFQWKCGVCSLMSTVVRPSLLLHFLSYSLHFLPFFPSFPVSSFTSYFPSLFYLSFIYSKLSSSSPY